jgi:hypothetical protein
LAKLGHTGLNLVSTWTGQALTFHSMLAEPPACLPPWTHAAAEKGEAVKQPMEADFDVQVREGHVEVIFRPTESHLSFGILVDPKDIAPLAACRT